MLLLLMMMKGIGGGEERCCGLYVGAVVEEKEGNRFRKENEQIKSLAFGFLLRSEGGGIIVRVDTNITSTHLRVNMLCREASSTMMRSVHSSLMP